MSAWGRRALTGIAALFITATLVMVGGPAAVTSYRHARTVAATFDETGMSPWLPLTTDGLIVAALAVMWWRRWRKQPVGWPVWAAFGLGMLATLTANVTSSGLSARGMDWGTGIVGVWPPLAFAATLELLALFIRGRTKDRTEPDRDQLHYLYRRLNALERALNLMPDGQSDDAVLAADPDNLSDPTEMNTPGGYLDSDSWADVPPHERPRDWPPGADAWTEPDPLPVDVERPVRVSAARAEHLSRPVLTDAEIAEKARALAAETRQPITAYALRKAFNIGAKRADRIMREHLTETVPL